MNAVVDGAAKSTQDLEATLNSQIKHGQPSFFRLGAMLPTQGRTDTPVAATENMTVVLKTYASCGENELHAHTNEDHTFVVLQGKATFYGPHGEERTIGQHEGVMLPHGTFYWFKATSEEPLVMLRVGGAAGEGTDRFERIGADGKLMDGFSADNKQVEVILSDKWFGPAPQA
ncbi:MAG: cupin domain-containing protein [Burkholderiales bacterium]